MFLRLKYDGPTGTLTIAGPSLAHEIVSQLSAEIHRVIHSDKLDFYGDWKADEAWQIVNSGSKSSFTIPIVFDANRPIQPSI